MISREKNALLQKVLLHLRWRAKNIFLPVNVEIAYWWRILSAGNPDIIRSLYQFYRHPIIIGGCGRSGTTLLLSILSCHPEILAIGDETGTLCPSSNMKQVGEKFILRKDRIIQYLSRVSDRDTFTWWAEKTPRNVLSYKRLIDHFSEDLRIFNVVRDGRDVITSRHPSKPDEYYVSIQRWIEHVDAGRNMEKHPQVMSLRYEDLICEYEQTIRNVCTFIGTSFNQQFLDYPGTARIMGTAESNAWFEERLPINQRSIGRWKSQEYQSRVEELMVDERANELLHFYGYIK